MNALKIFLVFLTIHLSLCSDEPVAFWESSKVITPPWHKVVSYADKHLSHEGKLMIKSDGFVYLKVEDDYIRTLFPMLGLKRKGYREPPYFRSKEAPGAHISVFYTDEHIIPEEIGDKFKFKPKRILVTHSRHASYVVLQVDSPELEKLRETYGLNPRLKDHPFHITLAKKER